MKKFTLFMLAACAWFTASTFAMAEETTTDPTVAESPTAAASLTSGYYVIKAHVKSTDGYIYHDTSDTNDRPFHVKSLASMGEVLTTLNSNTTYVWYVNALGDGTFTLQNLNSGDYIPAQNINNKNMAASVDPHTFANAAILKPQSYTSSSDTYTILDGGCLLACTNYPEIDRQIHCNTVSEHNLSYWDQGVSKVDGTTSITEFAFYKLTGNFSSDVDESNIQKNSILAVTETQGETTTKWAGVIGSTYTPHATTTITKNYGIAYSGVWSKVTTPVVTSTTDLTVSAKNCAFTIGSETTVTYSSANVVANPEVFGKYYRILASAGTGNCYITSEDATAATDGTFTTGTINRNSASGNYQSQIWQLEQGENGTVHFKNVNTGAYMNGAWGSVQANATTKGSYTIFGGTGTFSGVDHSKDFELDDEDNEMLNAYQGLNGKGLDKWSYPTDQGSYWRFEEVTTVPVTISKANYATVGYPFAVSVPDGVTAYTAESAADGYITLKEITSKVIPSNTGAILYKNGGGKVTLTITDEPNTAIGNNILTATTAKRTGYTSGDTYVLALNSSNEAAFLKSELTVVPANKAYIAATTLTSDSESNVLNFKFDGNITGIHALDTVDGTSAPTTYYDLNGRRVLYPAHGIYVTAKGKKVLVK